MMGSKDPLPVFCSWKFLESPSVVKKGSGVQDVDLNATSMQSGPLEVTVQNQKSQESLHRAFQAEEINKNNFDFVNRRRNNFKKKNDLEVGTQGNLISKPVEEGRSNNFEKEVTNLSNTYQNQIQKKQQPIIKEPEVVMSTSSESCHNFVDVNHGEINSGAIVPLSMEVVCTTIALVVVANAFSVLEDDERVPDSFEKEQQQVTFESQKVFKEWGLADDSEK
ncbi:hypothetical protein FRX31_016199 [Thalictrum thalictroides]|uniref:Uncharacterized protein n=1 Tax=Thalictrum thalictroides TaxID=46969 RepID=A0A7J6WCW2_THATH|nr:hypothetical protein FRX31_016199 [Thalictrum thalictroides]